MALSPLVIGRVENGKLIADEPADLVAAFRCHEGKAVEFQVLRHYEKRSLNQNSYYHGVIVRKVMEAMHEEDDEAAHDFLKFNCNYEMRTTGKGAERIEFRWPLSTKDLSTMEFEAYAEKCRVFAKATFGIYIPLPNEVQK